MSKKHEVNKMAQEILKAGIALDGTDFAYGITGDDHFHKLANKLYEAGYRKEGEVRKEAEKEIYKWLDMALYWDEEGICGRFAKAFGVEVEK